MAGILSLITNVSIAADKKLDRKQIYELQKDCAKSALDYFQRHTDCENGQVQYKNHYNIILNKCFIHISSWCPDNKNAGKHFWVKTVIDVNENKQYAQYIGSGSINETNAWCYFDGMSRKCTNYFDFEERIIPYMKE